jgi:hypothetical protein
MCALQNSPSVTKQFRPHGHMYLRQRKSNARKAKTIPRGHVVTQRFHLQFTPHYLQLNYEYQPARLQD